MKFPGSLALTEKRRVSTRVSLFLCFISSKGLYSSTITNGVFPDKNAPASRLSQPNREIMNGIQSG